MLTVLSMPHHRARQLLLFSLGVVLASSTLPIEAQAITATQAVRAPLTAFAKAEVAGSSRACVLLTAVQRKNAAQLAQVLSAARPATCAAYFAFVGKAIKTLHTEDGTSYSAFARKFVRAASKAKVSIRGSRATGTFSTSADGCRQTYFVKLQKVSGRWRVADLGDDPKPTCAPVALAIASEQTRLIRKVFPEYVQAFYNGQARACGLSNFDGRSTIVFTAQLLPGSKATTCKAAVEELAARSRKTVESSGKDYQSSFVQPTVDAARQASVKLAGRDASATIVVKTEGCTTTSVYGFHRTAAGWRATGVDETSFKCSL